MNLRAIHILGAFIPVMVAGIAACSAEEKSEAKWTCSNVKVPSGTSVECVATVSEAVEVATTYDCVTGSPDCPSGSTLDGPPLGSTTDGTGDSDAGGGSTSDGTGSGSTGGGDSTGGSTSDGVPGGSAGGGSSGSGSGGSYGGGSSGGGSASGGGSTSDGTPDYCPSCWGDDSHGNGQGDGDSWPGGPGGGNGNGSKGGDGSSGGGSKGGGGSDGHVCDAGGGGNGSGGGSNGNGGSGGNGSKSGGGSTGDGSYGGGGSQGGSGAGSGGSAGGDGGSGGGGGGGDSWTCVKEGCNRTCHKTPKCEGGTHPSKCGACVPDGESDDCTAPETGGCWVTGGGFTEEKDGTHESFGGNGMPMKSGAIRGRWTHVDHVSGDVLHGEVKYLVCRHVDEPGPGNPGGKNKGFDQNQVFFGGEARWAKDETVWFDVMAKDHGEPGKTDEYVITIRRLADAAKGQSGTIILETGGTLSGGNIQLHPANNGHPFVSSSVPTWVKQ